VIRRACGLTRPLLVAASLVAAAHAADANGAHGQPAAEPPTKFERFVVSGCSPCVKETHPIATIATSPLKLAAFPRLATLQMTRPGEIGIEVLRAHQLGRPSRQQLALRVTLSVSAGAPGEMYRIAAGVLDEEEIGALVDAVGEMARAMSTAPAPLGDESVDVHFHGGSLRVGVVRLRGETVAYVQAGDLGPLALRAVWEVPTTMYLPLDRLPVFAGAIGQGAAKIQKLRAGH
jgi:hypothetical protein